MWSVICYKNGFKPQALKIKWPAEAGHFLTLECSVLEAKFGHKCSDEGFITTIRIGPFAFDTKIQL